jgi:AraC family transcriptional regulator
VVAALDPVFVAAIANHSAHGDPVEFQTLAVFQDPAITYILSALQAESREGCPAGRLYAESLATALTAHLLRRYAVFPARIDIHKGGLPPARLRRVLDHIEAHLGEDTSLRQLAELAQLSLDHFATLFKQSTGLPPHRYMLHRRIDKAKEMLAGGRLSLAEIGYALGFPNQAHFTTMFRKLVGTTPGAYREEVTGGRPGSRSPAIFAELHNPPLKTERPHKQCGAAGVPERSSVLAWPASCCFAGPKSAS